MSEEDRRARDLRHLEVANLFCQAAMNGKFGELEPSAIASIAYRLGLCFGYENRIEELEAQVEHWRMAWAEAQSKLDTMVGPDVLPKP